MSQEKWVGRKITIRLEVNCVVWAFHSPSSTTQCRRLICLVWCSPTASSGLGHDFMFQILLDDFFFFESSLANGYGLNNHVHTVYSLIKSLKNDL